MTTNARIVSGVLKSFRALHTTRERSQKPFKAENSEIGVRVIRAFDLCARVFYASLHKFNGGMEYEAASNT